ncbi:hypothetical protein IAT38_002226 [Cryptococcus sp. DSM 104549]
MVKKATTKKPVLVDWDWVGTEVHSASDITPQHRRRAAGLVGGDVCPFSLSPPTPAKANGAAGKTPSKGKDVAGKCKANTCKGSYMCYNHLGVDKLLDPEAKKEAVNEKLGEIPEVREGPAGLRNLGATCYTTPLYHLALVFAMLGYSDRKVVDPMGLIEALRLNKGDQQDAAEFSKLFMSIIASEFAKHPNPQLRMLVREQFEGTMQYITECECGYQSITETTFLELELSLKDGQTLQSRLDVLTAPEVLDGDNKYNCPKCLQLRCATRRQRVVTMPPVIHFSLLRFVFDFASMSRKKSKASIKYPKEIALGGDTYDLRGVITHQGSSAHHGHFVCEAYDEADDAWFTCNDEEVTKVADRPRKRAKLDKPEEKDVSSSKDAYMLVYRRRDGSAQPVEPPRVVMEKVQADNAALHAELNAIGVKKEALLDEWDHVNGAKMDVLRVLPGDDVIIPRDSLSQWLESSTFGDLYLSFDMAPILCEHGDVDPTKSAEARTLSLLAFEKLNDYTPIPQLNICPTCVETGFHARLDSAQRISAVETFTSLNSDPDGDGDEPTWLLPKAWLNAWRSGKLPPGALPTSPDFTLFCEHGEPAPRSPAWVAVTPSALALLQSVVGDFQAFEQSAQACHICDAGAQADAGAEAQWRLDVRVDKAIKRHLDPRPPAFGIDYYVLPKAFIEEWEAYIRAPGEQPHLDMGLCEHGLLDFDPQMEKPRVISKLGWDMLCEKYGNHDPIVVQFDANPVPGKTVNIKSCSVAVCDPCRTARLSSYDTIWVPVLLSRGTTPPSTTTTTTPASRSSGSRSLRSRYKQIQVEAAKSTSVRDLKVEILEQTGITPILQKIFYKERELESDETIGGLGFLKGDELVMVEIEEEGEPDEEGKPNGGEGFGGTALLARIACPDCTFENDGSATCCEMCGRPFKYSE